MTDSTLTDIILYVQALPWWAVLLVTFGISFIENIFPPSPSDLILVFIGTLVGVHVVDFATTLSCATAGSVLGFLTMFRIGRGVDHRIVASGRYRFIPVDAVLKAESLFRRWGYLVIVVNRFLSGTRAVIAFLAGMSNMQALPCAVLSGVSALVWNALIIYAGMQLGRNWRDLEFYLHLYSTWVTVIVLTVALVFLARWLLRNRRGA